MIDYGTPTPRERAEARHNLNMAILADREARDRAEAEKVLQALRLAREVEAVMPMRTQDELRRKPTCMWCGQPFLRAEIDAHEDECGSGACAPS